MKIRIALAIDKHNNWTAAGWGVEGVKVTDEMLFHEAHKVAGTADGAVHYIIEVEVEVPRTKEIKGEVSEVKP